MTELEKVAMRMAMNTILAMAEDNPEHDRLACETLDVLTQALATTEPTKAELIAQARDLIEAQEHAHEVGYRMGFAAATEPTSESSSLESTRTKKG